MVSFPKAAALHSHPLSHKPLFILSLLLKLSVCLRGGLNNCYYFCLIAFVCRYTHPIRAPSLCLLPSHCHASRFAILPRLVAAESSDPRFMKEEEEEEEEESSEEEEEELSPEEQGKQTFILFFLFDQIHP